jgi:protein-L-isoaspartate(D-aspartate) O-methyltransferase
VTSTIDAIDWQHRAFALTGRLVTDGAITDPAWRAAFEQVPRHTFVPRFWALDEFNRPARLVDAADPGQHGEWLDAVYDNRFLATKWALQDGNRTVSSSASLPTLVARMLELLDVHDGHRVLEVGTGTGFNTGLLCHRVGDDRVTSIDIDAVLVAEATDRLFGLGFRPHLIAGDGAEGAPDGAPFDRILSTCASPGVPAPWIEQLADRGVIVAPFTVGGALAVLTKTGPDEVSGHLATNQAWFMPLRPSVDRPVPEGTLVALPEAEADQAHYHHSTTDVDAAAFANMDFRLWLSLHLSGTVRIVDMVNNHEDRTRTGVIVHDGQHRAEVRFPTDDGVVRVAQDARLLFDHVEAAWRGWQRHGCPERQRIGITARVDGAQTVWLDSPDSGITWPLPSLTGDALI